MSKFDNPLNNIKVASPCSADWNEMYGNDRRRFCGDCKLNVYNLSGMTRLEAETLMTKAEGRLCVRFYRRADGTVITRDCPVGWARAKGRLRAFAGALGVLFVTLFSGVLFVSLFSRKPISIGLPNFRVIDPTPRYTMGAIAFKPEPDDETLAPTKHEMGKMAAPRRVPGKTLREVTIDPVPVD
ncbi:MAG TPA: hypothetical protein VNA17_02930 [Pyrinomonadaceae bacterium]|nr:hypothetical protein [Pyrinomonadaceae bacterium]